MVPQLATDQLYRLSQLGKAPQPASVTVDPTVDMKTPPMTQVNTMTADKYFAYAAELLKVNPPHITDQPIVARMRQLGIEPGKSFDLGKADAAIKRGLERAVSDGLKGMQGEDPDARSRRERLADEHRYDGRVR